MEADVLGIPVPQGSKRVFHGHLVDVNHNKLRDWRSLVAASMNGQTALPGPVAVRLDFYLPRPKGHYGSGRNAAVLRPSAPLWPAVKPDIDKLVRACLDAMTGMAFRDDAQVVSLQARKLYADNRTPGVVIYVQERREP